MLQKRDLIFLSLLILGALLITSCLPKPPVTEGILKGQVIAPEGTIQTKDLTGQALPDATVNIIDLSTGEIIATTTTDTNGYYQVFVPPGGPYLLEAVKDEVKLQQITPPVEVGIEYDLGTADCNTTASALIAQAMLEVGENPSDINCSVIIADPNFNDVSSIVCSIIQAGQDPTETATVQQAVENFLNPPAPVPMSTPIYTVTYNGNGSTEGTVPTDTNNYEQGDSVTVLGNTGNLIKIQDGISLLFSGWNTATDGSGTGYNEASTFNMGSANVTLYAKWSAIGATGHAGGLIFYDKGDVSDGWRYLEAALVDQSIGIQWYNGTYITTGATGTALGTGPVNTTRIIESQGETTIDYAAGLARAYNGGSYNDWFLPSQDELNQLYLNQAIIGGFDTSSYYWSSSEYSFDKAWNQYFGDGYQGKPIKLVTDDNIRAVRIFRSTSPTYIVNYNANGSTDGTIPSDNYHYESGESVSVLANTGFLVKDDYIFDGWNTESDGSGTDRAPGSTFNMGSDNLTLYAKWIIPTVIDIAAIPGVTAPVTGATPITTITETTQYSGTVTWDPADDLFQGNKIYTATITLTAKTGYTLTGVAADFFTVAGAVTTNSINSGVVTAVFPETVLAVGDSYGGGIVAYILQSGDPGYVVDEQHGLIAAIADYGGNRPWSNVTDTLLGTTDTVIGTGQANTTAIIGQLGHSNSAAWVCDFYSVTVYDDWFLPSKDELAKLYDNKSEIGGFDDDWYWSSSEFNNYSAWRQNFSDGSQGIIGKGDTLLVRPVRAF